MWVEQLLTHKVPVVILDPVGRWWDLGLSADGAKSPGFPIAIFGGQHGQVELKADMGAAIARYVAERHVPSVVDLSFESKGAWRHIVADFCDELFRVNTLPVHIVIEEAPEFIPQRIFGDNATVFAAVDRLVRLGRNRGIGVTAIGQRLQTVNKDTVSQVDALIVLRLVDPQGKKAAREWVMAKGEEERADEFVDALAMLKSGSGYVWSPEWLEVFARVNFAARQTFHYDADRAAEETQPTREIARAVDTDELRRVFTRFMSAPPTDKKSDVAVSRRVAELHKQVESLSAALEAAQASAVSEEEIAQRLRLAVDGATAELRSKLAQYEGFIANVIKQGGAIINGELVASRNVLASRQGVAAPQRVAEYIAKQSAYYNSRTVSNILQTLGDNYSRFLNGMTAEEIGTEAGYDPFGGRFQGTLRKLVKRRVLVKDGERYLLNPAHLR